MTTIAEKDITTAPSGAARPDVTEQIPGRLHHAAYMSSDLARTRWFYEDVIGLPLFATFREEAELQGRVRTYCHCFFRLADDACLAFAQFSTEEDAADYRNAQAVSIAYHIALNCTEAVQSAIRARLEAASYDVMFLDHGYCKSLYVTDPDGTHVEFTVDSAEIDTSAAVYTDPRGEMERWLAGDRSPNNAVRPH